MRNILNLTLILLFALARAGGLMSQTLVTNDITANTTWTLSQSPFLIANNIRIDANVLLSIEPGVEVRVAPAVELEVEGSLEALGSESDPIVLRADVPASLWGGIVIGSSNGSKVELLHCTVSEGQVSGPALTGDDHLEIANCAFVDCATALADLPRQQSPVTNTVFNDNAVAAASADLAFVQCGFNRNGRAMVDSDVELEACTFSKQLNVALDNCSGIVKGCEFYYNPVALSDFGAFSQDSILDCSFGLNDTALVLAAVPNGTRFFGNEFCGNDLAVLVTGSSDWDVSGNCWCSSNISAIDMMIWDGNDQAGLGKVTYLPLDDCDYPGLVWPGDADNNGVADITDVLSIGVAYGSQGNGRPNATQVWAPQTGVPWGLTFDSGVDFIHADGDGDGSVTSADIQPVLSNFGETHQKRSSLNANGVPLCLEYPDSAGPGDTIRVDIYVGDVAAPAADAHGFAIVLGYDRGIIDSSTISTALRSEWLGSNLLDVSNSENKFHWAISRTDQQDTLTFGRMGGVDMIMIDDLAKTVPIVITVEEALLMDETGKISSVSVGNCNAAARLLNGLDIYPNPAMERVTIGWEDYEVDEIEIYGPSGQLKTRCEGMSGQSTLDLDTEGFAPGIYIVRAKLKNGLLTRKITIAR